jgi:GT2 family glycosyltransferase
MKAEPKYDISLAVVTYNNEDIIRDTVVSVVNTIPEEYSYLLYIIDNNSTDRTLDIVRRLQGNIEIIALKDNKGFGHGHNQVLPLINSRYHYVINPDIKVESAEEVRKMIAYLNQDETVGLLSPLLLNDDLSIQHLCKTNPTVFDMMIRWIKTSLFSKRQDRYVMKDSGYDKIMEIEYASGSFMVFRTELFQAMNGFDERFFMYLEDADITRRVRKEYKAVFFPQARVIHSWERSSHKKWKYVGITLHSMWVYFNKWGWKII